MPERECDTPRKPAYQTGKVDASIAPGKVMGLLSPQEVNTLLSDKSSPLYDLFRRCALAVLNSGSMEDNAARILAAHADFDIQVIQQSRGVKLAMRNAPITAFVDGEIIQGVREQLFSVLRDVVYLHSHLKSDPDVDLNTSEGITDVVFRILRHAKVLKTGIKNQLIICWGGHSITRNEYDYTKLVGYEMGLRGLNIGTGCGPGAMKGPMKGAAIGHAKQHIHFGRYIGLTEPDIIAAESPNPIVNELVILPDIEKRLESFVRMAHGIVVFPGGVGTAEEILYLLGILTHPKNKDLPFPLIFTAPQESQDYFNTIDTFIRQTLGPEVTKRYKIIIGNPAQVAIEMKHGVKTVLEHRRNLKDAYYFNWLLHIPYDFQMPFFPTHDAMNQLAITPDLDTHLLAANLRRAFSGIVSGNVKETGLKLIEQHGPYRIRGDKKLMRLLDELMKGFISQGRMKLGENDYHPCYVIE
ncbi:MAG: nucleotide 5'-monophosphate nucleosidase PpnN [Gammaproteobacteria bacterium]